MNKSRTHRPLLIGFAFWLTMASIAGAETGRQRYFVAGPVEAQLVRVIDGDTIMVNAEPWPQQTVSVLVRIRGIDTPELRSACQEQRTLARKARQLLSEALSRTGGRLQLHSISGDKYFGRVVADVTLSDNADAASLLLGAGVARPYDGGRKTKIHCSS